MSTLKISRMTARVLRHSALPVVLLLAGGCTKEEAPGPDGTPLAVTFTAGTEQAATPATTAAGVPQTRTTDGGDSWLATDAVGIFMLTTGGTLPGDVVSGADNVRYTVTDASTGALSGGPVYYPQSGNVDFIAYYPYGTASGGATAAGTVNTTDYTYNISLAGQTDAAAQNAIDVLYAKKTDVAKSGTAVNLAFGHVLSKVTLDVKAGEGIAQADVQNLAASAVEFGGMPQTATLGLQDGSLTAGAVGGFNPVKAATATAAYDATFTALVVPQNGTAGRTMVFTVGGETYTGTIPDGDAFTAGQHYAYPVEIRRTGVIVGMPDITRWDENDHGTGDVTEIGADIEWAKIPAGTFLMGSPADEPNREPNETQHSVTLTKAFYMSKYEVTNSQYAAFLNETGINGEGMGSVTYDYDGSSTTVTQRFIETSSSGYDWGLHWETDKWVPVSGYENHPVIYVTWYGAKAFADYYGYSLPTEAQWEYACRGGQAKSLPFGIGDGTKLTAGMANYLVMFSYDLEQGGQFLDLTNHNAHYQGKTTAVGTYPYANGYGLYDMHGNVYEWCSDWYNDDYKLTGTDLAGTVSDPTGPVSGFLRVSRGNYWGDHAKYCRSACRYYFAPDNASNLGGFRVVFVP